MKIFALGDIHGNYKGLVQCLERSKFNYQEDKLIFLGDIVDGIEEVDKCFEELLKIKNLVMILGNHDRWAIDFYDGHIVEGDPYFRSWFTQGGERTMVSYGFKLMPEEHRKLIREAKLYHLEYDYDDIQIFCHGGFNPNKKLEEQKEEMFTWDRDLLMYARKKHHGGRPDYRYGDFKDIFIGHTTTQVFSNELLPIHSCNVWMLDTGAGWNGKLTIMDIKTKEFWQSDVVKDLYPHYMGR